MTDARVIRIFKSACWFVASILTVASTIAADAPRPHVVIILADDKYGQGIVNREFLSENKVFYHQSVESALAAI